MHIIVYYNTHLGDNFVHACRVEVFASIVVDEKKSIKSYYIHTLRKELGTREHSCSQHMMKYQRIQR